ncbi:MAG TPA: HEAT repeat domain-containing protein [Planctomycetia bacterium]|nr:HEAT repeat domain-containing protein [Planctomycetia bacterium]
MNALGLPWLESETKNRALPRRMRRRSLRRRFGRWISNLLVGILSVGCAATPLQPQKPLTLDAGANSPDSEKRTALYERLVAAEVSPDRYPAAKAALLKATETDRSLVARSAAVKSLASFSGPEVRDRLLLCATDPSSFIRIEAVKGLAGHLDPRTAAAVGKIAIDDRDPDVRRAAVGTLAKAGDSATREATLGPLAECLADKDFTVARLAARTLEERTGQKHGLNQAAWSKQIGKQPAAAERSVAEQPARLLQR